jgi:hypothetical protein
MNRKIKLIWDFRGSNATKTAEHHQIHLDEYINSEKIELKITGFEALGEMHAIAYMVVNDANLLPIRDSLKPHRATVFEGE